MLRPLFVVFYIYSAWALLAVMTGASFDSFRFPIQCPSLNQFIQFNSVNSGVVSENMIAIRDQMQKEDEQREDRKHNRLSVCARRRKAVDASCLWQAFRCPPEFTLNLKILKPILVALGSSQSVMSHFLDTFSHFMSTESES